MKFLIYDNRKIIFDSYCDREYPFESTKKALEKYLKDGGENIKVKRSGGKSEDKILVFNVCKFRLNEYGQKVKIGKCVWYKIIKD